MILTGTPDARSPLSLDEEDLSADALRGLFGGFTVGPKDGLAFIPARLRPCPPEKCNGAGIDCGGGRAHRLSANVTYVTAFVVDLDHLSAEVYQETVSALAGMGLCGYLWETYSHDPAAACARVVFPFAAPLEIACADDWSERWWPELMAYLSLELTADKACRDPARLYYTPRKPTADAVRQATVFEGKLLDPLALGERPERRVTLPAPAPAAAPPAPTPARDETRPVDLDVFREGLRRVMRPGLQEIAKALLAGTELTPPPSVRPPGMPSRYLAWRTATSMLANLADGWESSAPLLELLRPSFTAEVSASPEDHTAWRTVEELLESARANAPSYKAEREARRERAHRALKEGVARLTGAARATAVPKEGDPPSPAPPRAPVQQPPPLEVDTSWASALQTVTDKEGKVRLRPTPVNVELILRCSDEWVGALRKNKLTRTSELWGGPLPMFGEPFRVIRDTDAARVADWFSAGPVGITVPDAVAWSRMETVAEMNAYDPLEDSLVRYAPPWDKRRRVEYLFTSYFGASADGLASHLATLSKRFMVQLIARALRPGCKADTVVVLEGPQGIGKSSALAILGGPFYVDAAPDPHDKDSLAQASRAWIIELGELDTLRRTDVTALKQFLSKTFDDYRPPYGRVSVQALRRCVFVGTTNEPTYLLDTTGNRRWWPVKCGEVDLERLKRDRSQLLAEALVMYRAGEQWHLTKEESVVAEAEAEARMAPDAIAETIEAWILQKPPPNRPAYLTSASVCLDVLQCGVEKGLEIRVGNALRRLKCERRRVLLGGRRAWAYAIPEELLKAPKQEKKSLTQQLAELKGLVLKEGDGP